MPEVPGLIVRGRGARIMAETKGQIAVRSRIVAVAGLRHKGERFFETSLMKAFQTKHAQADEARPGLGLRLGERGIALGELARTSADDIGGDPFPVSCRKLQRHIADLVGQNHRTLEGAQRCRRLIALVRDQCLTELQMKTLLAPLPLQLLPHRAAQPDAILQIRDGLLVGGPRQSLGAGLLPVVERPLGEPSRLGMLRLHLRSRVATVLQHVEQTGMQRDALGLEQALIGGVADQCVLEEIGRVRRRAAAKDQFGLDQLTHRFGELALRESSERGDGAMVEAAADDRRGLRHLLHRLQPIEPRHQRVVQRRRDRQRAQRAVQVIRVRALAQHARFDDRLGHLLDEQRHAVGLRGDLVEQRLGQALAVGDAGDDRLGRCATKPVQCQPGDDRMAAEGHDKGRACGDQHEHTRALDAIQRELDQLQGRRDRSNARPRSPKAPAYCGQARSAGR